MKIADGIRILDLGLYIEKENVIVFSDFHLGYEEALNKQGVLIPRFQFSEVIERLKSILDGIEVKTIIINGDLKHEFGKISETEWRQTIKLLDFFLGYCNEIILVKGNHDTILGPIAEKKGIKLVDSYETDSAVFVHGHKLAGIKSGKTLVIGHEHPAIGLRSNLRTEYYKCFLKGKFGKQDLIVMPSFNLVTEGSDVLKLCEAKFGTPKSVKSTFSVLKEKLLSPYLRDVKNFEVFVVGEKDKKNKNIFYFGKVGDLK